MKIFVTKEIAEMILAALIGEGHEKECRIGLLRGNVNAENGSVNITGVSILCQKSSALLAEIDAETIEKLLTNERRVYKDKYNPPIGYALYQPIEQLFESQTNKELRELQNLSENPKINMIFNAKGEYQFYYS